VIEETLRTLADQDGPPSRLRAEDVLAHARRRTRRRAALATGLAGATVALAVLGTVAVVRAGMPGPAGPGSGCVAEPLVDVGGGATVTGIDPAGRYVIGKIGTPDTRRAVRWTDGVPTLLPAAFTPVSVNAVGLIAGFTGPDTHGGIREQRPVVYGPDGLVRLPLPPDTVGGVAYSVNAGDDVIGTAYRADGAPEAVLWQTAGPVGITRTMTPAYGEAVTDAGVAVGFTPDSRPVRWTRDERDTPLPLPSGASGGTVLSAAENWAVGVLSSTGKGDPAPADVVSVRWNLPDGTVQRLPGFTARAVSASGTVAGLSGTGIPAYWRDGRVTNLPAPAGVSRALSVAGITADGHTMAGTATTPVLWHGC
jgi:hypothetical protein